MGAEVDAAPKRQGFVVVEASEIGLPPWNAQTGETHGGKGRSRLNRVATPVRWRLEVAASVDGRVQVQRLGRHCGHDTG